MSIKYFYTFIIQLALETSASFNNLSNGGIEISYKSPS
jgi:hypothetical protein